MNEEKVIAIAKEVGFADAAFMNAKDLVIKPEYRKFCEMNLCHQYDCNPACPPACGTVDEMTQKAMEYSRVLVLQTVHIDDFKENPSSGPKAKKENNTMADKVLEQIPEEERGDYLRMSAGPWHSYSCMSAYCVDAQCMADSVGMKCWDNDGKIRYFSVILFR